MKNITRLLPLLFLFGSPLFAQDTLPDFSLKNVGNNRIVVGWKNKFENVKQISIQRSFDSIKNFKTILTVANPTLPENGFLDTKAPSDRMYYRLYIMLDKGSYLFSSTKKPALDTVVAKKADAKKEAEVVQTPAEETSVAKETTPAKPKVVPWVPSKYVYTLKDGYIKINLPDAGENQYDIRFFTSEDEPLFELKSVADKSLKIDKANFYHAGWFKFELYENGELKEKNKFFLPKEF
jgi:hypothetical protein